MKKTPGPVPKEAQERPLGAAWTRRLSLLQAAAELLNEEGVQAIRIGDVAARAGVTRPVVYRHFSNRQEIILALLQEYRESLERHLHRALFEKPLPDDKLETALEAVLTATYRSIEDYGEGPWRLLFSAAPDLAIGEQVQAHRSALLAPWLARIRTQTGAQETDVLALGRLTSNATRTMVEMWLDGILTRSEALGIARRSVRALLDEFRVSGD